jgi:hypothetical protein
MGEMLVRIAADQEAHELNKLFGHPEPDVRRAVADRALGIRDEFPKFLNAPLSTSYPPNNRRQRSLRFAATELMRHVKYRRLDPGRGSPREFLRWLTWLEKDATNWTQAVKITRVLDYFLFRHSGGAVPPRVVFDWEESASALTITVEPTDYSTTNPDRINILVSAPDAYHMDNTSDED